MTVNAYAEFKPTLWQRIAWWHRWPWRPKMLPPDQWVYGTQPYQVRVRENSTVIGWHPVDSAEVATTVIPSRWACLAGIFKPPCFEVEVRRDHEWRAPQEDAS